MSTDPCLPRPELSARIRPNLGLFTDAYQLTMACAGWKSGIADREAVFHLFFRTLPFKSGFAIAAGLADALDYLTSVRFDPQDREYLASLIAPNGQPLLDRAWINTLADFRFSLDVEAMPEGTLVFPHQPLVRVKGPLWQCQLAESALLNIINFQTLIATKAARICHAAAGDPVIDFGLRRAQGVDGALSATRAAYIGGIAATSNMLAGKLFGIPVTGTHAHSWVMAIGDERKAFAQYAAALPHNLTLLVDTFDTIQGVHHAAEVGRAVRQHGHTLNAIRLDSGDLAYLSIEARRILDESGLTHTRIVASNDLDEHIITSLKQQGARIDIWGVGTRLITGHDQPALGGVYKLGAVKEPDGSWSSRMKISEHAAKTSIPGILQVRRYRNGDVFVADAIYDAQAGAGNQTIVDPADPLRRRDIRGLAFEDLLVPVMKSGSVIGATPTLSAARARAAEQLARLHPSIRRLANPHSYPAGLDLNLHEKRQAMRAELLNVSQEATS